MLIQSLMSGTIEGAICYDTDIGTQEFSCDRIPGAETWQDCLHCDQHPQRGFRILVSTKEKSNDESCSLNIPSICLQKSTSATMSGSSALMYVYNRRKRKRTSHAICPTQASVNTKPGDGSKSSISSKAFSGATKEYVVSVEAEAEGTGSPYKLPVKCNTDGILSKSGSSNECLDGEEPWSEEGMRSNTRRVLDVCGIDDSCSSSKLNLDVAASFKTDVDDTGECSSSGVLFSEQPWANMSGKDFCTSILKSRGLLEKVSAQEYLSSSDDTSANCCSRICRVCNGSETAVKMLICDNCEDAFHPACCYPRIKKIPIDEWFCYSCLKKKRKILKEKSTSNSPNIDNESGKCRNATSKGELGPIESMLRDIEPSKFHVRIGHEFQAEIPDWPDPIIDEVDPMSEPEEMTQSEYLSLHDRNSNKTPRLSSIGNWVQCQVVIEGIGEHIDGTICGKWRRAPLFEDQTDDWECFRAVLWDPAHADCAVPQELPTDEVLRQLKYIERLRPRLAAKNRKLDQTKPSCSQVSKQE